MKILIAGNSQGGALKAAHDANPDIFNKIGEVFFYVIPGGTGPYLKVESDKLVLTHFDEKWPPYAAPKNTPEIRVSEFDAVIISALGYIDGGSLYKSSLMNLATLPEFGPIGEFKEKEVVSDHCYQEMVTNAWRKNVQGFKFAKSLQDSYKGNVFVQPFPHISSAIQNNEDWWLRKFYTNYMEAHHFFTEVKKNSLQTLSDEMGFSLLDYPDLPGNETRNGFTPEHLMNADCLHPKSEYGAMVLKELASSLA